MGISFFQKGVGGIEYPYKEKVVQKAFWGSDRSL